MKVDLGIWDKLTRVILFLLVVAGFVAVGLWYLPNFQQNQAMRRRILELDTQIEHEGRVEKQLKQSIDALRNDPRTLERLARERLGYGKPGETIFRFDDAAPPGSLR
jgi:cell division protein FtsB